jgi:hypothetical protein
MVLKWKTMWFTDELFFLLLLLLLLLCVRLSAVYTSDIEADVLDELDGPLELICRIPELLGECCLIGPSEVSVSSTVGSLVGHAHGSGQLLGADEL